jgi:prophage regulatory protein
MPQELTRYVGWPQVCEALSLSRSTLERRVRRGNFPKPEELSPGRVGWKVETVNAAMAKSLNALSLARPSDLSPETAFDDAVVALTDAYQKLSGDTVTHVAIGRQATPAELQQCAAMESAGIAELLRALDAMARPDTDRATGLMFPRLSEHTPLDRAERVELLCDLVGRAVAKLKPLPGLPRSKRA